MDMKKECKHCGKKFNAPKDNPTKEYCSEKCWLKEHDIEDKK